MKPARFITLILSTVLFLTSCAATTDLLLRDTASWRFIQSVGGIALGQPVRDVKGRVTVPVHCDISGFKKVTVKPTTINFMLVCLPPKAHLKKGAIHITVVTTIHSELHRSTQCPPLHLGKIAPGKYPVIYHDPDGNHQPLVDLTVP